MRGENCKHGEINKCGETNKQLDKVAGDDTPETNHGYLSCLSVHSSLSLDLIPCLIRSEQKCIYHSDSLGG